MCAMALSASQRGFSKRLPHRAIRRLGKASICSFSRDKPLEKAPLKGFSRKPLGNCQKASVTFSPRAFSSRARGTTILFIKKVYIYIIKYIMLLHAYNINYFILFINKKILKDKFNFNQSC